MEKCGLGYFKRYCDRNYISNFKVEVDHCLTQSFNSVRTFLVPDGIYFDDGNGNSMTVHGITSVSHEENRFVVCTNYLGNDVKIRICCNV